MATTTETIMKLSETKILRLSGTVLDVTKEKTRAFFLHTNPISVFSEDGRQLGWASLHLRSTVMRMEDDNQAWLDAFIAIDNASPERLDIENGVKMYAWAYGRVDSREYPFESTGYVIQALDKDSDVVSISSIVLRKTPETGNPNSYLIPALL